MTEFPSSSPGTPGLKPGINHVSAHGRGADPDPNAVYALGSSSGESARLQRQSDELASVNTVFTISPDPTKSPLSPAALEPIREPRFEPVAGYRPLPAVPGATHVRIET